MAERERLTIFPQTATVKKGHLIIGGCDTVSLAGEFGTPLYVFDDATLRQKCAEYRDAFASRYHDSLIAYACKAFINKALAQIFREEGLGLDVVSGGELAVAQSVNFPMERVYFNGNNKSRQELQMAIDRGVGRIVIDNLHELSMLDDLVAGDGGRKRVAILIRISPGIDPHTHTHLATGVIDSKFGLPLPQAEEAIATSVESDYLDPVGLHYHIGSQILELSPFERAVETSLEFAADMRSKHGFQPEEIDVGGGLGIAYTGNETPPTVAMFAEAVTDAINKKSGEISLQPPRLIVEPGRSITAQAGVAIYTAGAIKEIEGIRKYVSVDGGMADNIRPSLYGAKYDAVVANKADDEMLERVTVAGKYCESGDILINDIDLPKVAPGDVIAIPCCGAYCLSLASNYNSSMKPAIALVRDGKARLIRRRESYEDLMGCDIIE